MDVTKERLAEALANGGVRIAIDRLSARDGDDYTEGHVRYPALTAEAIMAALREPHPTGPRLADADLCARCGNQFKPGQACDACREDIVDADIPDPEVAAIAAIVAAMDALDEETILLGTDVHERVIRWAMARYLGPATSGGCPIAVVLGDGMHSCTLRHGLGGDHDYADNPDAD